MTVSFAASQESSASSEQVFFLTRLNHPINQSGTTKNLSGKPATYW
jgi:hypothetical protein